MEKEKFEKIINNLEERIEQCYSYLGYIVNKKDLEEITVNDLKNLITFCRSEQGKMDTILTTELYHILGMGNLTVQQQNKLISNLKKYMYYRSDIKAIACNATDVTKLPDLPTNSEYKLTILGDFKLKSEKRKELKIISNHRLRRI